MSAASEKIERRRSGGSAQQPNGSAAKKRRSDGESSVSKRRSLGGRSGVEGLLVQRTYKNTLPDIPAAPKFLPMPFLDSSRFVEYQHTSLEKAYRSELHVGRDLGVPVELIDPTVYEGGNFLHLDPKDEALLRDAPAKSRHKNNEEEVVPWLRNTTYISTDNRSFGRDAVDWSENKILGGHVEAKDIEEYKSKEAQIEAIERTFEAAVNSKIVHPKNPNLTPVEVTPILPSKSYWGHSFLHGIFDNDPTTSLRQLEKATAAAKRALLSQGMLSLPENTAGEEFTLFLPQRSTLDSRNAVAVGEAPAVGEVFEFDKARDYVLDVKNADTEDTYVLSTVKGVTVYKGFNGRVKLSRKREKTRDDHYENVTLVISHRDATAEEVEDKASRCELFNPSFEEAEAGIDGTIGGAATKDETEATDAAVDGNASDNSAEGNEAGISVDAAASSTSDSDS